MHDSPIQMRDFLLSNYIKFFYLEDFDNKKLQFISLTDNSDKFDLYSDDTIIIRDVKDIKAKKELYRQLIIKSFPNEIESELKLYNVPEIDSKSSTYNPVKTAKHYKNMKLKTCVDLNLIISHFVRIALSAMHFMDCSNLDKKPLEGLILGGSVGTVPYFLKRIFKEFIKVTAIEANEKLKTLGNEYFGFDNENVIWEHNNCLKFLQSKFDHNKNILLQQKKNNENSKKDTQNNTNTNNNANCNNTTNCNNNTIVVNNTDCNNTPNTTNSLISISGTNETSSSITDNKLIIDSTESPSTVSNIPSNLISNSTSINNNNTNTNNKNQQQSKKQKNKLKLIEYDLIIINELNIYQGQSISPNPEYLSNERLNSLKV